MIVYRPSHGSNGKLPQPARVLEPQPELEYLGRAVVRTTVRITNGPVAGCCYTTSGAIRRTDGVRIIRDGVVIYPLQGRAARLDSLQRWDNEVAEVCEGYECKVTVAGYDDIKPGDVIEAFRVAQA